MTASAVPPDVVADATAAAGAWLRAPMGTATSAQDDAVIAALAATAITLAEAFCARLFVARPIVEVLAPAGCWQALGARPVTTITAIEDAATGLALAADAYAVDIDADGTGWVRTTQPLAAARLTVRGIAGDAATWAALPPPIGQGIAMLVAHLFDHRDGETAPPAAIAALWRPWRRMTLVEGYRA